MNPPTPQTIRQPAPPPSQVKRILVWHQGALGDLLLALPALKAVAAFYSQASFTGVGYPERLRLLQETLPLEAVWDGSDPIWLDFFTPGPVSPALQARLAPFDLAVLFAARPETPLRLRLQDAGLPGVIWLPTFPTEEIIPVAAYQARFLSLAGIPVGKPDYRLHLNPEALASARRWRRQQDLQGPLIALAPGSGHARKNWPLAAFLALSAALRRIWSATLWWLLGPAETEITAALRALLPPSEQLFLTALPLPALAAYLSCCDFYVGNDSGTTHLAAAVAGPAVLALFGPTDPRIWAPAAPWSLFLASPSPCSPCSRGRDIPCPQARCLEDLPVTAVLAALEQLRLSCPSGKSGAVQEQADHPTQHHP